MPRIHTPKLSAAQKRATLPWVRNEQDERAMHDGCFFVEEMADYVVDFFRKYLCHYEGEWAGKPFELRGWQRDELIMPLFGWIRPNGTRRFRKAGWWFPKKNGKTAICSGLAIYGVVGDGENGAKVFSAALKREQAAYIFNNCQMMIQASPQMADRLEIIESKKRFTYPARNAFYEAMSADGGTNEGVNASLLIKDEIHAWTSTKGRNLHGSLKYAGSQRRQPLDIEISTAGEDVNSLGYERYEYAKKIKDGEIINTAFHAVIYEAPENSDWGDPEVWKAANPALGDYLPFDSLREDYEEARQNPAEENNFLRYRLNIWVAGETRWIKPKQWRDASGGLEIDEEQLIEYPCCGGLDLGMTDDSSAWVKVWRLEDDVYVVKAHFFHPDDDIVNKGKQDNVDYFRWAKEGYYTLTPGTETDYAFIEKYIRDDCEKYNIKEIAYDPYKAKDISQRLDADGYPIIKMQQGYLTMSEPTQKFRGRVLSKKLIHFDNPVMRWMAGNAVTTQDPAGNVKLDKSKSRNKIDGMVAAVMAFDRARLYAAKKSVYEKRGAIVL